MSTLFEQKGSGHPNKKPPNRISIYLLPVVILIGIVILIYVSNQNGFGQVVEVNAVRARLGSSQGNDQNIESFQAAGWLRAEPYSISVTSLVSGVVEKIHVVEGEPVKKGQLLAELNNEDALLDLRTAKNNLAIKEQNLKLKQIKFKVEKSKQENHLKMIDTLKIEMNGINNTLKNLRKAEDGVSRLQVEDTEYLLKAKKSKIEQEEILCEILSEYINLAEEELKLVKEKINKSKIEVERKQLQLKRHKITSPVQGVIQNFYAREGRKQMLGSDSPISTTVAKIFQPEHLFVRVDVPLLDAFKVFIGQKANIRVDGYNEIISGTVTHVGGEADEQKNTLSARVKLLDLKPKLRPEMLAQVVFLEPDNVKTKSTKKDQLFILKQCIINGRIAVINNESKVNWRNVTKGTASIDDWVEIKEGLNAGEQVITNPNNSLQDNQIVKSRLDNE